MADVHYWSTLGPGNITGTNVGSYTGHLSPTNRRRIDGGGILNGAPFTPITTRAMWGRA